MVTRHMCSLLATAGIRCMYMHTHEGALEATRARQRKCWRYVLVQGHQPLRRRASVRSGGLVAAAKCAEEICAGFNSSVSTHRPRRWGAKLVQLGYSGGSPTPGHGYSRPGCSWLRYVAAETRIVGRGTHTEVKARRLAGDWGDGELLV